MINAVQNPVIVRKLQFLLADMFIQQGLLTEDCVKIPDCFPVYIRKAFDEIDWAAELEGCLSIDSARKRLQALVDKEKQVQVLGLMGLA